MHNKLRTSLVSKIEEMLEDLTYEEIAEGLVNNTINFKKFRDKCIKQDFKELTISEPNRSRMDIYRELSLKYGISENTIKMIKGIGYY